MTADEHRGDGAEQQMERLAARVEALERQVAALSRERMAEAATVWTAPVAAAAPPPKPLPPPPLPPRLPMQAAPAMREDDEVGMARPVVPERSLENRLGSQIFNLIGIVAILVGVSWFLKLAIERGWVGPVARVLIGLAAGAGLVVWSESFRRRGLAAFSFTLKAVGSSVLYLSLWASFRLYGLLPASVALLGMVLVTAWNGYMAWAQDAELLATYGLVGGFATPLLLSSGGDHEGFLLTYVAALDVALVLLMRWKPWQRLLLPALGASALYFIGWYSEWFHRQPAGMDAQGGETLAFAAMFWAVFALVSVRGFGGPVAAYEVVRPALLPLADATFFGCAVYSVLQDSGLHDGLAWAAVGLAAVYLGLMRLQDSRLAEAVHLGCAVVFLTLAIPLKASGHTLTAAWLVEGLVLYWVSTRVEDGPPRRLLGGLSAAGFGLGLLALAWHWMWAAANRPFWNADCGSALLAVGTLGGAALLAAEPGRERVRGVVAALGAIDLVAVLLIEREIAESGTYWRTRFPFTNPDFATAMVGLAVLAGVVWAGYSLVRRMGPVLQQVAGATLVLFNLLAILTVESEIGDLWSRADAGLARSLAISGFLMLYGAGLLAAGFWRRSAFVRWQGLILLMFTVGKVFVYDISGLSQGYRVVSFLALGALLLAVSLAYQKDWLGLKVAADTTQGGDA